MEVQAELDRLSSFKGGHVNSSILHGSQQRFSIKVGYKTKLLNVISSEGVRCTPNAQ